jgi:hypothetical protein
LDIAFQVRRQFQIRSPETKTHITRPLEAADEEWEAKKLDLSGLEKLLADLLAEQLASVHDQATGSGKI